jgi:hypothetical protein
MTKFKIVRLYKTDDVPDHIVEEVNQLVEKLGRAFEAPCRDHDQSIILSAFNRFHAALICSMVTEAGLAEAVKTEMVGLGKNAEHMSGQKIFRED